MTSLTSYKHFTDFLNKRIYDDLAYSQTELEPFYKSLTYEDIEKVLKSILTASQECDVDVFIEIFAQFMGRLEEKFFNNIVKQLLSYTSADNKEIRLRSIKLLLANCDTLSSQQIQDILIRGISDSLVLIKSNVLKIMLENSFSLGKTLQEKVRDLVRTDQSLQIRSLCIKALQADKSNIEYFIERLRDKKSKIRVQAIERLQNISIPNFKPDQVQQIIKIMINERDKQIREAFINLNSSWISEYTYNLLDMGVLFEFENLNQEDTTKYIRFIADLGNDIFGKVCSLANEKLQTQLTSCLGSMKLAELHILLSLIKISQEQQRNEKFIWNITAENFYSSLEKLFYSIEELDDLEDIDENAVDFMEQNLFSSFKCVSNLGLSLNVDFDQILLGSLKDLAKKITKSLEVEEELVVSIHLLLRKYVSIEEHTKFIFNLITELKDFQSQDGVLSEEDGFKVLRYLTVSCILLKSNLKTHYLVSKVFLSKIDSVALIYVSSELPLIQKSSITTLGLLLLYRDEMDLEMNLKMLIQAAKAEGAYLEVRIEALEYVFTSLLLNKEHEVESIIPEIMFSLESEHSDIQFCGAKWFCKLCYLLDCEFDGVLLCLVTILFNEDTDTKLQQLLITFFEQYVQSAPEKFKLMGIFETLLFIEDEKAFAGCPVYKILSFITSLGKFCEKIVSFNICRKLLMAINSTEGGRQEKLISIYLSVEAEKVCSQKENEYLILNILLPYLDISQDYCILEVDQELEDFSRRLLRSSDEIRKKLSQKWLKTDIAEYFSSISEVCIENDLSNSKV